MPWSAHRNPATREVLGQHPLRPLLGQSPWTRMPFTPSHIPESQFLVPGNLQGQTRVLARPPHPTDPRETQARAILALPIESP